jgi:hypothetical protein
MFGEIKFRTARTESESQELAILGGGEGLWAVSRIIVSVPMGLMPHHIRFGV